MLALSHVAPTAFADNDQNRARSFNPPIGICTSLKNAELMHESGGDYLEVGVRWFLVPVKPAADFAGNLAAAKACPLPILAANGFLPGSLKCVGPQADHAAVLAYAKTAFERAKQVGIRRIVFGSSGARAIPDGFDRSRAEHQFIALLMKMGPLAAANNVVVVIEPLNSKECNFINTVLEGARIVEAVGHPNVQLLADIYHMLRMDEPPANIRAVGHLLRHVHIAEKKKRTAPGVAGDDFRPYLEALAGVGYHGGISMECRWEQLAEQLPVAVETLREQMAGVHAASGANVNAPSRVPARVVPLPFGTGLPHWVHADGKPFAWKVIDGTAQVVPGTGSAVTRLPFQDFRLHVEFNVPKLPPLAEGEDRGNRGNSGVYLQRRYEVQILDSYGQESQIWDCGALYRARKPDVNASKPAGQWQSYDILFRAPRWTGEGPKARNTENARITVWHNRVLIHDDVELENKTGAGQPEGPEPGPILLQDHGNEVQFRNVWIVPLD
jgi:sugar phosphate isomerase/epimerase